MVSFARTVTPRRPCGRRGGRVDSLAAVYCPDAVNGTTVRASGSESRGFAGLGPTVIGGSLDPVSGAGHGKDDGRLAEAPPQRHHGDPHHVGERIGVLVPGLLQKLL